MKINHSHSIFSYYQRLNDKWVVLNLLVLTILIRFPFFFRDYIDRDESTFILMGQSWVDGQLPYLELWDLKPPLTFAFFAIIISVFGKSFVAIRFVGALLVVATAFFTFKISIRITTRQVAFWMSVFCVVLLSLFGSLQGVMSEHICMAFFVPGLYIFILKKKPLWFFLAGLFMGLTVMVKLNMAYPVLLLGLFLLYKFYKTKHTSWVWNTMLYGGGILVIIALTILPYYKIGEVMIWWKSVILAPLEYTEARRFSVLKLAPTFLLVGGFLFFSWKKRWLDFKNTTVILLTVGIIGVLLSFLKGGRINGHYLIQLYPMLLILIASTAHALVSNYKPKLPKAMLLLLLLIPTESYLEYGNIIQNKFNNGTFFNGEGFTAPQYIRNNELEKKNILFLGYHIGYWNLESLPPTKAATHPSNICRDELFPFFDNERDKAIKELRYIMEELRPKTIVLRQGRRVFDKKEEKLNAYIDAYLLKHYRVHGVVEKAEILQRL
ncbi:glycosyltransferase [Maribacter sp. 4U21]|nr:glycosyltransferase [Maribacter sp. 4U21]